MMKLMSHRDETKKTHICKRRKSSRKLKESIGDEMQTGTLTSANA